MVVRDSFSISERAVWAVLHGHEPPLSLSSEAADLPIDIISDSDGRTLARIHPKYAKPRPPHQGDQR